MGCLTLIPERDQMFRRAKKPLPPGGVPPLGGGTPALYQFGKKSSGSDFWGITM